MLSISLPPEIVAHLTRALAAAGTRECGGVLMAEHCGHNHFTVRRVTIQRDGSISRFFRELRGAVVGLQRFFKETGENYTRFNYLGEWHSHPLFAAEPSATDHASMRQIIDNPSVGANFVVLLVLKLNDMGRLTGSAHTYLPGGIAHRSTLLIEQS